MEQVTAEHWRRTDPSYYEAQRMSGYLEGVGDDRPAVMSVNMQAACLAFNDFVARIHGFRFDPNAEFATERFRFVHGCYENSPDDGHPHPLLRKYVATGDNSLLVVNNVTRD